MNSPTSSPTTSPQPLAETRAGFEPDEVFPGFGATSLPREHLAQRGVVELNRLLALGREVTRDLLDHPGCVEVSPRRCYYSRRFQRFVVDLRGRYQDVEVAEFACVVGVPQATLTRWLGRARQS